MTKKENSTANIGYEQQLWKIACKLWGHMDPSDYKHILLGLIFLKYLSDSFEEVYNKLKQDPEYYEGLEEDRDSYLSENVFYVPKGARWEYIKDNSKSPEIGKIIDDALIEIEKENKSLKGVLDKRYAKPDLDKTILGETVDMITNIKFDQEGVNSKDILGRVYEYFLEQFASAEGKGGGEFYTPACVVNLLVNMIEPFKGRVYDPCCGSGGMFVQSGKFIEEHGGNKDDIAVYGQESNPTTWRLCKMNLAIRGINGNIGETCADSFLNDLHKELKADFILANPPFNKSDYGLEKIKNDIRWKYGTPPAGNANYAWIQHIIYHLSPSGIAGFVLANGSLSSNTSGEGEIREKIIKYGLVDCIIALPSQLFYTTQIPVSLWFISRDRHNNKFRERSNEILFIDARKMGEMIDRKHRELTKEEIQKISETYHNWRNKDGKYEDIKGFCKSSTKEELEKNGFVLTPGRYVESDYVEEDDEAFEEKMKRLTSELKEQIEESKELDERIKKNLESIGFKI